MIEWIGNELFKTGVDGKRRRVGWIEPEHRASGISGHTYTYWRVYVKRTWLYTISGPGPENAMRQLEVHAK